MKFVYPIKDKDDAEALYQINRVGKGGFYPIGSNYSYHGGMHFEAVGDEDHPVVAIADGEIIAYRYMKEYVKEPKHAGTESATPEVSSSEGTSTEGTSPEGTSPEGTSPEGTSSDTDSFKYSNCFVLIRHQYESPRGRKLIFYSLYNHLRPWEDDKWTTEQKGNIKIFGSNSFLVKKGGSSGLPLFNSQSTSNSAGEYLKVNHTVVAKQIDDQWAKTESGKFFIHKDGDVWAEPANKLEFTVKKVSSSSNVLPLFSKKDTSSDKVGGLSKDIKVIATKIDNTWAVTDDNKFFVHRSGGTVYAEEGASVGSGPELDSIVCEPVSVKAGDLLGYTGLYEAEELEGHRTVHIEVFAGDDAGEFIKNSEHEGKPSHIKVAKNTQLKKKKYSSTSSITQFKRMKYTVVEIVDSNEGSEWIRVKDKQVAAHVQHGWLNDKYDHISPGHYTAKSEHLATFQGVFPGWSITSEDSSHLTEETSATKFFYQWKPQVGEDRVITIEAGEHAKEYWVQRSAVYKKTYSSRPSKLWLTNGNADANYEEISCFEDNPDTLESGDKTVEERIVKIDDVQKLNYEEKLWYGIEMGGSKQWVPKDDIKEITPYDWPGFKILKEEAETSVTGGDPTTVDMRADYDAMPPFFQQILDKMNGEDEEGEEPGPEEHRVLFVRQIKEAMAQPDIARRLSRVICVHPSEWSKEQWDGHTSGMGEGERTDKLKRRVEQLCWWESVKGNVPEGKFPSSPMVHHWNPVAFVEHMVSLTFCAIDAVYFYSKYDEEFAHKKLKASDKVNLSRMFDAIEAYYNNEQRTPNIRHIVYMIATAKHETGHTFAPIDEYGNNSYFEEMYDPVLGRDEGRRTMARENGNVNEGDGVKYHGRGYVQLTWHNNYKKAGKKFGVNLVANPELAKGHELAAKIMIWGCEVGVFTSKKLTDYINDTTTDYFNARRIINGLDKAEKIKGYAERIERCVRYL